MKKQISIPKFKNESDEADWWASREGREYVKQKSGKAKLKGTQAAGSRLVTKLSGHKKSSVQISIRLPEKDIQRARRIAIRKGIGYQTLMKMLLHESLEREVQRK